MTLALLQLSTKGSTQKRLGFFGHTMLYHSCLNWRLRRRPLFMHATRLHALNRTHLKERLTGNLEALV